MDRAPKRFRLLPREGTLLVSTDLHGNFEDFEALRTIFRRELEIAPGAVHWAQLGDIVHGPDHDARLSNPELYGYEDRSPAIARGFLDLIESYPEQVHYVLGNHDHGHVGGPHPAKFHVDEVEALESSISDDQRRDLRRLFENALFAMAAPAGLFLAHGSPDDAILGLDALAEIPLVPREAAHRHTLRQLLTSYGQPRDVTERLLARISGPDLQLRVVVHGHDRDVSGFFTEGENQICPCIFGAPRENKRYLRVDLAKSFADARALEDGVEIRRLYSA